jgi:hypothetical protein
VKSGVALSGNNGLIFFAQRNIEMSMWKFFDEASTGKWLGLGTEIRP